MATDSQYWFIWYCCGEFMLFCTAPDKNKNKTIRTLYQKDIVTIPYIIPYWNRLIENIPWKNVWSLPFKYMLTNKVREVTFKLIHRFYPAKCVLKRYKPDIESECSFCKRSDEDISHLFWKCSYTEKFWSDVLEFIHTFFIMDFSFCFKDVFFGVVNLKTDKEGKYFIINLLFLLAKYHIHKCKFRGSKPFFPVFESEVNEYLEDIQRTVKRWRLCGYIQNLWHHVTEWNWNS